MEPAFYRGDLLFLYHDREVNDYSWSCTDSLMLRFKSSLGKNKYDSKISLGPHKRWRNCCFQN